MKITIFPYRLYYHFPFKIAHTSRDSTSAVYILLEYNKHQAWGEATFPPYVSENIDSFKNIISQITLPSDIVHLDIAQYIKKLDDQFPNHPATMAAVDIALHQLQAYITGISIQEKYGIINVTKETSVTIGISTTEEMVKKITSAANAAYFKLKVDQTQIDRIIQSYQHLTSKPFVVDANQGFTSPVEALFWCRELKKLGCAYMEQPFNKDDLEAHQWLKYHSPIPIIADESFQRIEDLPVIVNCFHGINVKLMKSGGIAEGYQSLLKAKDLGLLTLIGCMSESSVAVSAAWHLAPLADWVDLDGPLLIKNDLFNPQLNYTDNQIIELLQNQKA